MVRRLSRVVKAAPHLKLADLLRRRKMSLKEFTQSLGVVSYEDLKLKCNDIGVLPPSEEEFLKVSGVYTTSDPQQGIVVIENHPPTPAIELSINDAPKSSYTEEYSSDVVKETSTSSDIEEEKSFDDISNKKQKKSKKEKDLQTENE